jgi:hypothetical protein
LAHETRKFLRRLISRADRVCGYPWMIRINMLSYESTLLTQRAFRFYRIVGAETFDGKGHTATQQYL